MEIRMKKTTAMGMSENNPKVMIVGNAGAGRSILQEAILHTKEIQKRVIAFGQSAREAEKRFIEFGKIVRECNELDSMLIVKSQPNSWSRRNKYQPIYRKANVKEN